MDKNVLEEIGLTKSEINVYLALLELGSSSTGKIVDKSRVSSSKIYEILDKLMQKGLVSFIIKSGIKHFEAAPPKRIMDYMKEKEENLNKQKDKLKSLIPQLELKQYMVKSKSEATIFKGLKGAETAFKHMINSMKKGDEWIAFVVDFKDKKYYDLLTRLHKIRSENGFKSRIILNEKHKKAGEERERLPNTEIKYVSDDFQTSAVVNVAGNITLLNIMAQEITVFMIENKDAANSFRNQFEKLWQQDTVVTKGMESLKKAMNSYIDNLQPGEDYISFGATFGVEGMFKDYASLFRDIHKRRFEEGVKAKLLFQQGSKKFIDKYTPYKQYIDQDNTKYKFMSYKTNSPVAIFPSKKKSLLVIQKKDPIIITINNEEISNAFKKNFEALWNQDTMILKGLDSIQNLFDDMLNYDHADLIGARGYFVDRRTEYVDKWEKNAIKKGFKMRNIVEADVKGHRITGFPFSETKYILPKEFSNLSVFWIYGNKVAISNWTEKEPIVVIINNKSLYEMYKKQFELLWKKDKF
jgi:HTH-type transcriptional regulator, sugar sensing transcriptional regulator